jgi:class 3 adenylate cyclase
MPMEKKRFRLDFMTKFRVIDEKKGLYDVTMVPDPARYEKRTINGEDGYFDKYDKIFISWNTIAKAAEQAGSLPLYAPAPSIRDLKQHFGEAKERILRSLESEIEWKPDVDRGNAFLSLNVGRKLLFVVLYIDIVNSTQLSRVLSDVAQRTLVPTFLREMTLIVDGHGGYVHKYTGDGLIAFFPAEQNYTSMTDGAVDCAFVMKLLMHEVLNPVLKTKNYPLLEFRIGIDSGETQIVGLGAENVKSTPDLLSYTMNLAAKICAVSSSNQIMIGESVYRTLHVTRKKHFEEKKFPKLKWNYLDASTNRIYPLFGLTSDGSDKTGRVET